MRVVGDGIFFIVKSSTSDEWVGVFSTLIYNDIGEDFNEGVWGGNITKKIKSEENLKEITMLMRKILEEGEN